MPVLAGALPIPDQFGHAAVDEQLDARDEAAVVGGEEHGDLRDLVRVAHAAEGNLGGEPRLQLLGLLLRPRQAVGTRCIDRPGSAR